MRRRAGWVPGRARGRRDAAPGVDLRVRLGPIELPGPIVAASGTFGHGDEVARVCDPNRIGAVTAKSQACFPWAGNPAPRLHLAPSGMVNAVGLQGPGIEHWLAHGLPSLRARGARVLASIWGLRVDDFATAAAHLRPAAADLVALEVNLSCPNLDGHGIFAHDADATEATMAAVTAADPGVPIFAKLSADVTDVVAIARAALAGGATGLTLVNTVRAFLVDADERAPVLGAGNGGLSGPAIKPIALRAVHDVTCAIPGVPVIGTGGVMTGVDAAEMLLAGASAVGVGTATFLDPRACVRITEELAEWCAAHDVARVAELTGAVAR